MNGMEQPSSDGSIFVYDLETVPDESRYPRPEKSSEPPRSLDFNAVLRTVRSVKEEIEKGLTDEQVEDLLVSERESEKPRAGVIDALDSRLKNGNKDEEEWKRLALNPWKCRIVAMGIRHVHSEESKVWLAENFDHERELLSAFWLHHEGGRRCGYNITAFDDPVIVARSMILDVMPRKAISLRKYGNNQSIDLAQVLFPNNERVKLKELCRALGIVPPAGYDTGGEHVLGMVDEGRWSDLALYCQSDVMVETELLNRALNIVQV